MRRITRVLVANRGEIAVRIIRAARDRDITSIAVYADQDANSQAVKLADQAWALEGSSSQATYLDVEKVLDAARKSGADAVHPGYGFLAERADFARAVIEAGLIWIGPRPESIELLGDKLSAKVLARRAGAPLAPGSDGVVTDAKQALRLAEEFGLPIVIKASYGGGGRGLRVARSLDEVVELFESATREARSTFGRGECFVEKYLDRPRHVETQCLADRSGQVRVVSTRDCSVQRRYQKLVEEAPAPYLDQEQIGRLTQASENILSMAGYIGAGTCEFLVARDGFISFLEVNTRLQVEHPVTEEITGIDLVLEQFRLAEGELLENLSLPAPRGHSLEFRINAEDPARGFLPAAGEITRWNPPSGPGVRLDSGFVRGDRIGEAFDSLIAKLIITGPNRVAALARARRAFREFEIGGVPTLIPFYRDLLQQKAFISEPFDVFTGWVEGEYDNRLPDQETAEPGAASTSTLIVVEVDGRQVRVRLPENLLAGASRIPAPKRNRGQASPKFREADDGIILAPMQSTVVKVTVGQGDAVESGDLLLVLEAMKMEQPVVAPKAGVVSFLGVQVGDTVVSGQKLAHVVESVG